jgi:NAD(P)-dependent dehydrogenase (short-subunit alcohol dehydrogenase family)
MVRMPESEYEGRVAVITGGGRGFGKAFGHALANRGAHAVLADIDAAVGEAAAKEIQAAGGAASAFPCDVADEHDVEALVGDVVARLGGIDILINNAGLHSAEYGQRMDVLGLAKVRRLFDVNVMGVINCTMIARSAMAGRPGACVFNISRPRLPTPRAGRTGCPNWRSGASPWRSPGSSVLTVSGSTRSRPDCT